MVTRYCPKCGKQITLDDSLPFGFCTYCGTKIELSSQNRISSPNADTLSAYIEQKEKSAQAFIELGQWKKARELMYQLTQEHPESGLAWLAFGMIFAQPPKVILEEQIMRGWSTTGTDYYNDFPFTADTIMKWLQDEILVTARKMLRKDEMPLYQQRVEAYRNSLKEQFRHSDRIIDDFIRNPMALAGYINTSRYEDYRTWSGFFEDGNSLYYADLNEGGNLRNEAYRITGADGKKLISEIVCRFYGGVSRSMYSQEKNYMIQSLQNVSRYREIQLIFADESTLYLSPYGSGLRMDKTEADKNLKEKLNVCISKRIKAKECPICGSYKGFFGGCSIDCMSLFKQ